jgi:ATP-dependent Zn protease
LWRCTKAARQRGAGIFGLAKSYDETTVGERVVTFADVAGIEKGKAELVEMVDCGNNQASGSATVDAIGMVGVCTE